MSKNKAPRPTPEPEPASFFQGYSWIVGLIFLAGGPALILTQPKKNAAAPESKGPFGPTVENKIAAPGPAPEGMVWGPGGEFSMGSEDPVACACEGGGHDTMFDARPIHRAYVDGFFIDATEVTNSQFAKFAEATGYVTV